MIFEDEMQGPPQITFTWFGWRKPIIPPLGEKLHWTDFDKNGFSHHHGWKDFGLFSASYTSGKVKRKFDLEVG